MELSEGMRALLEGHKKLHESVLKMQAQIEEEEAAYLEETPHGNIIRGWDGFIDAKQPRKDSTTKKVKPYSDAEHLFSSCCFYATLASEPTLDLVDPTASDEANTSSRRKLSSAVSSSTASATAAATSASSGKGNSSSGQGSTSTAGTPVASSSGSKLQRAGSFSERKSSIGSGAASGKSASSLSSSSSVSATSKASKLKKRKREKLESQESGEQDDSGATAGTAATAEKDFLDVV